MRKLVFGSSSMRGFLTLKRKMKNETVGNEKGLGISCHP